MTKREQAANYRHNTMLFLARAGYASTRQLARGIWGACNASKRVMCGRTVRWLQDNGYVVTRREGDSVAGERLVALTQSGAKWVKDNCGELLPMDRPHGRDWLRHNHGHRTACNSVLAALWALPEAAEWEVWSELEVQADFAPIRTYRYRMPDGSNENKIPDLLAKKPDDSMVWFEIENAWRSTKDMQKLEAFMRTQFVAPKLLQELWFVITAEAAKSIGARLRQRFADQDGQAVLTHVRIFHLNADTLELIPFTF